MPRLPNAPISDEAIRAAFMMEAPKPRYDAVASFKAAPKPKLSPRKAALSAYKPSLGEKIESGIGSALSGVMGDRYARHFAGRAIAPLTDLTPVGDAMSFADAGTAFRQGRYGAAAGNAAIGALGSIPGLGDAAAPAAKAMFLGVMAKNADHAALKRAQTALENGGHPDGIRRVTGWFKGRDDKWRFEIPDNELSIGPGEGRLGDVASHPELYANYPQLADVRAVNADRLGGSYRRAIVNGKVEPGELVIGRQGSPYQQRSIAAHEIQHAVQDIEGFARGGSPGEFTMGVGFNTLTPQDAKDANALRKMAAAHHAGDVDAAVPTFEGIMGHSPQKYTVHAAKSDAFSDDDLLGAINPMESYKRLAGEVEARNVQKRMDFEPAVRAKFAPWATQDTPHEEQTLRWLTGGN